MPSAFLRLFKTIDNLITDYARYIERSWNALEDTAKFKKYLKFSIKCEYKIELLNFFKKQICFCNYLNT